MGASYGGHCSREILMLLLLVLLGLELLLVLNLRGQELLSCHLLLLRHGGGCTCLLPKGLHDWPRHTDASGRCCRGGCLALLKSKQTALIEIELLSRDVHIPVNYAHVEALKFVDVVQGDAAHRCYVLVRVIDVIVHLAYDQHCRQY